jgi:phosphatidate cytidylyltransferase
MMLARILGVIAAFYLLGAALMLLQHRRPAGGSRTSWRKFTTYGALLVLVLVVTDTSGLTYAGMVLAAIAAAAFEIGRATRLDLPGRLGLTAAALAIAASPLRYGRDAIYPLATALAVCVILLGALSRHPQGGARRAGWAALGLLVLAVPAAHLLLLEPRADRLPAFAFLFLVVCSTDAFAELVGKRWPVRRGVLPVSPNKSIGGLAGGLGGGIAMALALAAATDSWPPLQAAATGAVVAVAAICGDLIASSLKRAHGIKDFGTALADHGGVFDRFDSLFFAAWPYYWIVQR